MQAVDTGEVGGLATRLLLRRPAGQLLLRVGMKEGADMDEAAGMDPQHAAAIMQEARARAERELNVRHPVIFASWALVYLLGYGVVWLSVRGQHPYRAPAGWALALLALLAVMALGVTAMVTDRATSGVGGASALKRRIYWLSIAIGLLGLYIMEAALRYNAVSRAVLGVVTASAPLLVAGVVLVAGTAAWLNWYAFGLGVWLIAVAAFSGFAGPVAVWAVDALAVGIPFLLMAAIRIGRSWS
jgi:hypothetical protein